MPEPEQEQKPKQPDPTPAQQQPDAARPVAAKGEGVKQAEAELAAGADVKKLGKILWQHPAEKDAILELIQSHPAGGNAVATDVLTASQGWHWDNKAKSLVWGEPHTKGAEYFIAGAEPKGVKWNLGQSEGSIGQNGLDTRYHLGGGDLHGTANYKGGKGVAGLDYEAAGNLGKVGTDFSLDPKTKGYQLGVHGEKDVGPGQRVGMELHGGSAGFGMSSFQRTEQAGDKVTSTQSYGQDKEGHPTVGQGVALSRADGFSLDASHSSGQHDKDHLGFGQKWQSGSAAASLDFVDGQLSAADLSGAKQIDDKTKLSGGLGYANAGGVTTLSPRMSLEGDGYSVGGQGAFSDNGDVSVAVKAAKKLGEHAKVSGDVGYQSKGGVESTSAALSAVYASPRLYIGSDLKLRHTHDGTEVQGSGEGIYALEPGLLYGHAFGEAKMGPGGVHTAVGAGITLTPHDHVALTAAGVIDPATHGFDARLSVDIFAKKIDASSLSVEKRKPLISLFAGVKAGGLDDKTYGVGPAGNLMREGALGDKSTTGYLGVSWSF